MSELDWSPIHPDHVDRLKAAYGDAATQEYIDILAASFPAPGVVSLRGGNGGRRIQTATRLDGVREAATARAVAKDRLAEAEETWRFEVRAAYRDGATAAELADVAGVSLARVHQLVAGARKG